MQVIRETEPILRSRDTAQPREVAHPPARRTTASEGRGDPTPESGRDAGLCLNCDHRTDCALPITAGGVWFCEEYE